MLTADRHACTFVDEMTDSLTHTTRPALRQADLDFATFCEQGAGALMMFAALFGSPAAVTPRLYTAYMPKAQRTHVAHRAYSDGLRTPSRKPTAAELAKATAAKWYS